MVRTQIRDRYIKYNFTSSFCFEKKANYVDYLQKVVVFLKLLMGLLMRVPNMNYRSVFQSIIFEMLPLPLTELDLCIYELLIAI